MIWKTVDPTRQMFPKCGLANSLLFEDKYHNPSFKKVGKGSTLVEN